MISAVDERRIKVAIIGCGQIGTHWDAAGPLIGHSLTHAGGFDKHERATVVAFCDVDRQKAGEAARHWGAAGAYTDPKEMFARCAIELAVIATSTAARRGVIEAALEAGVRVLVIEKPLADTVSESLAVIAAIERAGAKGLVNYSRHWDPGMRALRNDIGAGALGSIQRLVGIYGKGLANNGSHLIDLAGFLCDARPLRARSLQSPLDVREACWSGGHDSAVDAQVIYGNRDRAEFHLTMLGTDQNAFTCFEMRVIGRDAVCEVSRGGRTITMIPIEVDPDYAGYRIPGVPRSMPAHALQAMDNMVDEAVQLALGTVQQTSCDVYSALQTARTVEAIKRSSREQGAWMEVEDVR